MPYIDKEKREQVLNDLEPQSAGELNFMFSILCKNYLTGSGECYQHFNDCIGALEGAKLELYRRHIGPYEDTKIKQNGDL